MIIMDYKRFNLILKDSTSLKINLSICLNKETIVNLYPLEHYKQF